MRKLFCYLTSDDRGHLAIAVAAVALILLSLEVAAEFYFWWGNFQNFFRPVSSVDMLVDLQFFAKHQAIPTFIFGYHNEHVVVTTRTISLADFVLFGLQYRLHQWLCLGFLIFMSTVTVGLLAWYRWAKAAGVALFIIVAFFAPLNIAVATMPYFLPHYSASATGIAVSLSLWLLIEERLSPLCRFVSALLFLVFGFLTLGSGANGVVLILSALFAPMLLDMPKPVWFTRAAPVVGLLTIAIWLLWFTSGSPTAVANAINPFNWLGVIDYYLTILSLPAYYVLPHLALTRLFGAVVFLLGLWAIYLAWRTPRANISLFLGVSLLLGHHLSCVMIAFGRSGGPWAAADPKYFYYSTVILVATALTIGSSKAFEYRTLRTAGLVAAAIVGIFLTASRGWTLDNARALYKGFESASLGVALGVTDPTVTDLSGITSANRHLYDFPREHPINLFAWPAFRLLGGNTGKLQTHSGCSGSLDVQRVLTTQDITSSILLEGWAIDSISSGIRDLAIIVANSHNEVVGLGTFVSARPDVIAYYRLELSTKALLGWRAFVRPTDNDHHYHLYVVDRRSLAACRFVDADLDAPDDAKIFSSNSEFIHRLVKAPVPTMKERLELLLDH